MRRAGSVFGWLSALVLSGCDGGATTSSSGTGGSATSASSTGAGTECASPMDCPGTDGDCRVRSCESGVCGFANVPTGTMTPDQVTADCKKLVCDGQGGITALPEPADPPADRTVCTADACDGLAPTHTPVMAGKPCAEGDGKVCDGGGHCVECNENVDCASGVCSMHFCVPPSCADAVKNGTETDLNCGGADCAPCAAGKACVTATDCADGVCDAMTCQAPSCTDVVKNGLETDIDCGGPCPDCATGKHCLSGQDCASAVCGGNPLACVAPSCTDAVMNGFESDVDCGSACPSKCVFGTKCNANADCLGGVCNGVSKTCDASCTDTAKNGSETDVDCGGTCMSCALGKFCNVNADCQSSECLGGLCVDDNGCTPQNAMDLTSQTDVTIEFGDLLGLAYSPRCIRVNVGTKVTFVGAFASHPFQAGRVAVNGSEIPAAPGTSPFPIAPSSLGAGTQATYVMTTPGAYPYYCVPHGGSGMNGAVLAQ
ncbi:MAG: plastocyanin/azurin family copper-binding protein [Polyangiaceae bacterium]